MYIDTHTIEQNNPDMCTILYTINLYIQYCTQNYVHTYNIVHNNMYIPTLLYKKFVFA
jgi:hypothetical protein